MDNDPLNAVETRSPWRALSGRPYVLASDKALVDAHNVKNKGTPFEIELSVLPDPFVGSPRAPIWLLNLNPGLQASDLQHPPAVEDMTRKSIALEGASFWYLEEQFSATSGYRWWHKTLGTLIKKHGVKKISETFFCVELFPYHSERYKPLPSLLPSQHFTIDLVKAACAADRRFVVMRQLKNWEAVVPELRESTFSGLRNPQRPWITPGNLTNPMVLDGILES